MQHPEKWRETVDPFSLPYKQFELKRILGYPHAGNDVFHAEGIYRGETVRTYIKAARQSGADIENEVFILSRLDSPIFPKVIDFCFDGVPFSVTLELMGERLSTIVGDNADMRSISFLAEYGRTLAKLHSMKIDGAKPASDRRFFHAPSAALLSKLGLSSLQTLFEKELPNATKCFCHGDFHYANILWQNGHISGILDFELSGIGDRDFDIAWAIFRRPGQKFMKTDDEISEFLRGYSVIGEYNELAVRRYMAQCYIHFLEFCADDKEYCAFVRTWLNAYAAALL